MQYTVLSVGLFAAMATASQHPQHFHHRRQYQTTNTTTAAGLPSTTLTVIATEVKTITSCAPTVTNCPAREQTVAQVVTLTKTIGTVSWEFYKCPKCTC